MNTSLITDFDEKSTNVDFPFSPADWSPDSAIAVAVEEGIVLNADHWEAINSLQLYFRNHKDKTIILRDLHDALDEKFHYKGGIKYLYRLFPAGPVHQACKIAGLKPPIGSIDSGFGCVT